MHNKPSLFSNRCDVRSYVTLAFHVVVAAQSMSEMRLILNLAVSANYAQIRSRLFPRPIYIYIHGWCITCSQAEKISKLVNRRASGSHQQRYLSPSFLFGVSSGGKKTRAEGKQTRLFLSCSVLLHSSFQLPSRYHRPTTTLFISLP